MCFLYFQLPEKNLVHYMLSINACWINNQTRDVHHGTLKNTEQASINNICKVRRQNRCSIFFWKNTSNKWYLGLNVLKGWWWLSPNTLSLNTIPSQTLCSSQLEQFVIPQICLILLSEPLLMLFPLLDCPSSPVPSVETSISFKAHLKCYFIYKTRPKWQSLN